MAGARDVILAVGPHDRSALDIYQLLLSAVAVEVPAEDRSEPPCCDELGEPPAGAQGAEALAAAVGAAVGAESRCRSFPGKNSRTWHIVFFLPLLSELASPLP
jgi:hypothetical protein